MYPVSGYPHGNILHATDKIKTGKLTLVQSEEPTQISLVLYVLNFVNINLCNFITCIDCCSHHCNQDRIVSLSQSSLSLIIAASTLTPVPEPQTFILGYVHVVFLALQSSHPSFTG